MRFFVVRPEAGTTRSTVVSPGPNSQRCTTFERDLRGTDPPLNHGIIDDLHPRESTRSYDLSTGLGGVPHGIREELVLSLVSYR